MVNPDRTWYYNSCSLTIVQYVELAKGNPELSKHVKIIVMIMIYDEKVLGHERIKSTRTSNNIPVQ